MGYAVEDLRPGDIVLVSTDDVFGRLIRWATVNPYTHAVLVGEGHLIEALEHVSESPLKKYTNTGTRFRVQATSGQKIKAIQFAGSKLGLFYGLEDVWTDFERDVLHVPATYWSRKHFDCSALLYAAYLSAGVVLTHAIAPSPADLSYSPLLLGPRPWEQAPGRLGD